MLRRLAGALLKSRTLALAVFLEEEKKTNAAIVEEVNRWL
jgi:hypothetical protein